MRLTQHYIASSGIELPEPDESLLLDYVMAANGTFARGTRPGLEVCMPVSFNLQALRGLEAIPSYVKWGFPKVPRSVVEAMLSISRDLCQPSPREALFHLSTDTNRSRIACPDEHHLGCAGGWHLEYPDQRATDDSVLPIDTGLGTSTERALIEVHSHHWMSAEFSAMDNEDEGQGFRVYAVIGNIFAAPEIRARVGLFGHFWQVPATYFFELPEGLNDCR
jgi:hypothetical protein